MYTLIRIERIKDSVFRDKFKFENLQEAIENYEKEKKKDIVQDIRLLKETNKLTKELCRFVRHDKKESRKGKINYHIIKTKALAENDKTTNNPFKHNGFYTVIDNLKGTKKETNIGDFLQEIRTHKINPNTEEEYIAEYFLHGWCDMFAAVLSETFGYKGKQIQNELNKNKLNHAFCTFRKNNKTYYVDVRGITNDFNEFFDEFEDYTSKEYALKHIQKLDKEFLKDYGVDEKNIKEACIEMINNFRRFYDAHELK